MAWTVFFAGATWIHLKDAEARGALAHAPLLHAIGTRALIAVPLAGPLLASGALERTVQTVSQAATVNCRGPGEGPRGQG